MFSRRLTRVVCFSSVCALLLLSAGDSPVEAASTVRISVGPNGEQANGASRTPAISGDGRYVVFESSATNLVAGDTNNASDIFVFDRQTATTTRVSVSSGGAPANGSSSRPAISGDGRIVVFESLATNLGGTGLTGYVAQVFAHDRQTGETVLVSRSTGGTPGDSSSIWPAVSADGRVVAFLSSARNLVGSDTNDWQDVFVHDRVTGETTRVSVASNGAQGTPPTNQWMDLAQAVSLSADGRHVAFAVRTKGLVPGDTNDDSDVFLHDRLHGETLRVSETAQGIGADAYSMTPVVSGDGAHVLFMTRSSNLDGKWG